MRIAIDGIPLLTPKTGIGKYTFELSKALGQLRSAPTVRICYGIHWSRRLRRPSQTSAAAMAGESASKQMFGWVPGALKDWIKKQVCKAEIAVHRPDVFHATNYVSNQCDIPTVATIHDLSFLRYPEMHPAERLDWLASGLSRTIQQAGHIIADSRFTKKEIISLLGVPENKVSTVHLGVSNSFRVRDQRTVAEHIRAYDLKPQGYILSVGTIEPRKNMLLLLRAYESLPSSLRARWPLVTVGLEGWKHGEVSKSMEKLTQNGGLRPLGFVPEEQIPYIYNGAALFVYPSIYEGFGLPPLEAMASGVPTVVSDRTSLPEIAGNAAIYVNPDDPNALAEVIRTLLEDSKKRIKISGLGLRRAAQFTWEACADKTYRIYQKLLAETFP